VEALAEADQGSLDQFIALMKAGPLGARVDDIRIEWGEATGEFASFTVQRSV
jgi:acylphosphatase